jgi:hypothetical protein
VRKSRSISFLVLLVFPFCSCSGDNSSNEPDVRGGGAATDGASKNRESDAALSDSGGSRQDTAEDAEQEANATLPQCEPAEVGMSYTWNFDDDKTGATPAGFTNVLGTWNVEAATDAPSKPNMLRQSGTSSIMEYPVLFADAPCFLDLTLKVSCHPESGVVDQACGLVFRLQNKSNYYVTRANVLENNVRLYRVIDGVREQLATAEGISVAGNQWHTLQAKASGSTLTVSFDGQEVISIEDDTFSKSGRIGLWLKADSVTSFDDLEATAE